MRRRHDGTEATGRGPRKGLRHGRGKGFVWTDGRRQARQADEYQEMRPLLHREIQDFSRAELKALREKVAQWIATGVGRPMAWLRID